jgi:hypothetical protein
MKIRSRLRRANPAARHAALLFTAGSAAWLCLSGCATHVESPIRQIQPCDTPKPLRLAVLPPRIDPGLLPARFQAEKPLIVQLIDGRGITVTSVRASRDIGLEIVAALTRARVCERVFLAADRAEAEQLGANSLLAVSVRDYRTVQLGANPTGLLMVLTSPLMSQYWLRWRTIEARFDWDAQMISIKDGATLYRRQLKRSYTAPVRSASGEHFTNKMLSFLQERAAPDFIGELFQLNMRYRPEDSRPGS